jgi:hypothetical protein
MSETKEDKTEHSPKPFKYKKRFPNNGEIQDGYIVTDADGNCVAILPFLEDLLGDGSQKVTHDIVLANARMFAAAPDLLAALQSVLPILDAVRFTTGLGKNQLSRIEKANAAIKLATESHP